MADKKIFWDKGHGGEDPGAVANGLLEKTLVHRIIEYAMDYMDANYTGFEQKTSRTGDQTVQLSQRDDLAEKWGADVFVSAHINAGGGTGFETFVYNGGVSSKTIALQNVLHAEILNAMLKFGDVKDRGNKKANYSVLRETDMPAVLTENLFIDSKADAAKLKNDAFVKAVGQAHARGVAKFLGLKAKPEEKPAASKPAATAPGKDNYIHRVIVDGKQVGAYGVAKSVGEAAEKAAAAGAKKITIERV